MFYNSFLGPWGSSAYPFLGDSSSSAGHLRAITWGRVVESMRSIHLLRQLSVCFYYFLVFHDSQASQCCLNQPSINMILKHSFVFVSTAILSILNFYLSFLSILSLLFHHEFTSRPLSKVSKGICIEKLLFF